MTTKRLGQGDYAEYRLEDGVLYISGEEINLSKNQEDSQVILDIKSDGAFVASIEIPPKKYFEAGTKLSENGTEEIIWEAVELDIEAVTLHLWPIVKKEKEHLKEAE